MKKIFLAVLVFFIISSCSQDNETPSNDPSPTIIAKWQLLKGETKQGQDIISTQFFDPLPNCVRNFIDIKAGTVLKSITHSALCIENAQEYQYTYTNGILNYGNINRKVEKLTNSELVTSQETGLFRTFYSYQKAQ